MRIDFEWDLAKAADNATKHGVTFEEANGVSRPSCPIDLGPRSGARKSVGSPRRGTCGHLLVVVHTWNDIEAGRAAVRIVSARRATTKEARQYREEPTP